MSAVSPTPEGDKTPFQRVVDEVTGGCGCACHTGIGYRTSCEHCYRPAYAAAVSPTPEEAA